MSEYLINSSTLTAIGDAIRSKTGDTEGLSPAEMAETIEDEMVKPSGSETKTANGTYDVTNLASLVVAIPTYDGSVS